MDPVTYPNRAGALRQRLLGRSGRPPKPFVAKSGATYWLKTPTLALRGRILDAAGLKAKDGETPSSETLARLTAQAALALVMDEEGKPVFDGSELEALLSADTDSEAVEVANAAAGMLGGGAPAALEQQLEEARAVVARLEKQLEEHEGNASGGAGGAASPTTSPAS